MPNGLCCACFCEVGSPYLGTTHQTPRKSIIGTKANYSQRRWINKTGRSCQKLPECAQPTNRLKVAAQKPPKQPTPHYLVNRTNTKHKATSIGRTNTKLSNLWANATTISRCPHEWQQAARPNPAKNQQESQPPPTKRNAGEIWADMKASRRQKDRL